MPELPEAETIAGELRKGLPGRKLRRVDVIHADILRSGIEAFAPALVGRRIEDVGRRGKNVVVTFDGDLVLVVNLGMSGRLLLREQGAAGADPTHPAVVFHLSDGGRLVYHDPRRFGALELRSPRSYRRWSQSLGPEPLSASFSARRLAEAVGRSRSPIRSCLLDQARIAGVGNIYANEALHRAKIHPARPARELDGAEFRRLHRALRKVLREALSARGTTLRDYRTSEGAEGSFSVRLRVYGQENRPCPSCREPVERIVFGHRSAFLCPRCQPELRTVEHSDD